MSALADSLADFVTFVHTHLTGDEKGEAAEFMDRLFRQNRIAKKGGTKGKNFGDLLLPDRPVAAVYDRRKPCSGGL